MDAVYTYAGRSFVVINGDRFEMADAINRFGFAYLATLPVVWL
jgi:hypothetical protein